MKAFKVVRAERDKLLSCVAKDFMCVEYKVGEFVRGDLGPLFQEWSESEHGHLLTGLYKGGFS